MSEIVDVGPRLQPLFPVGGRSFQIEVLPGATGQWVRSHEPTAVALVRTLVWDIDPTHDTASIRDIKEQEVSLGWPALFDDEARVAAFVAALGAVLADVNIDAIDSAMPSDIMRSDVLKLARARTQADFEAALRGKSRLGPYLRAQP